MKVKVKNIEGLIGFYDNQRRRANDVFEISDYKSDKKQKYPDAFSEKWMDIVDDDAEVKKAESKKEDPAKPVAPSQLSKPKQDATRALKDEKPSGDEEVI